MSPAFEIDLARRPTLIVDVAAPDTRWVLKIRFVGEADYYVQPDTPEHGIRTLDIIECIRRRHPKLPLEGTKRAQLMVGASGRIGANAAFKSLRIVYPEPPTE